MQPWRLLLAALAGWINREQAQTIEFQRTQIRVLKELLGPGRLRLNDDQRRRLAAKGKPLGASCLATFANWSRPTRSSAGIGG